MSIESPRVICVLLAAGGGSRYEGPTHKLLAPLGDTTVVGAALRHVLDADLGPVLVITGAVDLGEAIQSATGADGRVVVLHHPGWQEGQATSLQLAIDAARRQGADAVVVGLADQPFVDPEAWRNVAAAGSPIAVATYAGRRRNPVKLHRSIWDSIPREGDEGARTLMRLRPELVEEVPCSGSPDDIDTEEDLPPWPRRS